MPKQRFEAPVSAKLIGVRAVRTPPFAGVAPRGSIVVSLACMGDVLVLHGFRHRLPFQAAAQQLP